MEFCTHNNTKDFKGTFGFDAEKEFRLKEMLKFQNMHKE
jgi:hypothetical protein